MKYKPGDGTWIANRDAKGLKELRQFLGDEEYFSQIKSLKAYLCSYFSTGDCSKELGKAISPCGATPRGGKILKVRWDIQAAVKAVDCVSRL